MTRETLRTLVDRAARRGRAVTERPRTRAELAKSAGISRKHLTELIAGRAHASEWVATRLARVLQVPARTIRRLVVRRD